FGIGVNTGKALAGTMGSADRLEYSVIGDAVNTAARLADAAPGGRIWIGADTFAQIKDSVTARLLAPLTVKGKQEPLEAYEVEAIKHQGGDAGAEA
ncbi:MAG: adenylate/guanylate cyclase domain-containing protein, partial [Chloroflexota bacterium]